MADLFVELDNVREAIQMTIEGMDRSPKQLAYVENAVYMLAQHELLKIGLERKSNNEIDTFDFSISLMDADGVMNCTFKWNTASIDYSVNICWYVLSTGTTVGTADDAYDRAMKGI